MEAAIRGMSCWRTWISSSGPWRRPAWTWKGSEPARYRKLNHGKNVPGGPGSLVFLVPEKAHSVLNDRSRSINRTRDVLNSVASRQRLSGPMDVRRPPVPMPCPRTCQSPVMHSFRVLASGFFRSERTSGAGERAGSAFQRFLCVRLPRITNFRQAK